MSRLSAGEPKQIELKATNNVYTVLVAVSIVVVIVALVVLYQRSETLFQAKPW
jgi:uncharacterized membrane protein YkgB